MVTSEAFSIAVEDEGNPVQRYAAQELRKYARLLYGFVPTLVAHSTESKGPTVLLGRRESFSADGFELKTIQAEPPVLLIAGGSDRGTLFGVYELLERWGMRFVLTGDLPPGEPRPMRLSGFDERHEPAYPIRALRPLANLPEGAAAWDLDDFTAFIDQMIKLKFNTFVFAIMESGPWLEYEFRGVKRPAGDIFYGYRFPIDEDFVGKELFDGQREFYNPVLVAAGTDEGERKRLGIELVQAIIRHCKTRGLMTLLTFSLLEPPTALKHRCNEWATLPLPNPASFAGAHLTITPTEELGINPKYCAWMNVLDPAVQELIAFRLMKLIDSYPEADFYHLWVSEHRSGVVDCDELFQSLDRKYGLSPEFSWNAVLEDPSSSPFGRERYQNQMKGDLVFLYALDKILHEQQALRKTSKPDAAIGIAGVMPQLAPIVTRMLPAGSMMAQFLDYGSHGTADRTDMLVPLLKAGVPVTLEVGINDDNTMYFPQANVESLERVVSATAPHGLKGYVAALWQVRQSDIAAAYLGRASWNPHFTATAFYESFLPQLVGSAAAAEFERGHRIVESADRTIRPSVLYGYAFLFNSRLIETFIDKGVNSIAIEQIRPLFQQALVHFIAASAKASPRGRPFADFWLKRTRFAIDWLDFSESCANAGKQIEGGESRERVLNAFDDLLRRSRQLTELIASDVTHPGDLGQIANMNQHVHRYLKARRDAVKAPSGATA